MRYARGHDLGGAPEGVSDLGQGWLVPAGAKAQLRRALLLAIKRLLTDKAILPQGVAELTARALVSLMEALWARPAQITCSTCPSRATSAAA